MSGPIKIKTQALSVADALGYRGQKAVADALVEGSDYRVIGGHMVRLLLLTYPTAAAMPRSTIDADAALGSLEVVGPLSQKLLEQNFTKQGGNLFYYDIGPDQRIEINLLAPRTGHTRGIRPRSITGVGQIDTLTELRFVFMHPAVVLDMQVDMGNGEVIEYQTRVPDIEAAVVLKAHGWKGRRSEKDIADLHTLLEIRDSHSDVSWRLDETKSIGFRKDTVKILQDLQKSITRKRPPFPVPHALDRLRLAGLIAKHVSQGE